MNTENEIPDQPSDIITLKSVAIFEAAKGTLVLCVGIGLLALIHEDLQLYGENVVRHLHMNPAHEYPRIFIEKISQLTPAQIKIFIAGAAIYSTVRFIEGYGLWKAKKWAEWFAIISSGIYLPIELYEIIKHPKWLTLVITLTNVAVLVFLIKYRLSKRPAKVS